MKCVLMVAPPGAGKSTIAKRDYSDHRYINQDSQGPAHMDNFDQAILDREPVIVDRMNFNKEQRNRYLKIAKEAGYETEIVVIHESYETCYGRMLLREGHETIKDEKSRRGALRTFFTKYERVSDDEADIVTRRWPECNKVTAIICDLDGTLCNIEHRKHFVEKKENFKKMDWKSFFESMVTDTVNIWCLSILQKFSDEYPIVFCTGRPSDYEEHTREWLHKHVFLTNLQYLFMRPAGDYRRDDIVKEIILDFEILTRFTPFFALDDRTQVVQMWRKRGLVCLQVDEGNF